MAIVCWCGELVGMAIEATSDEPMEFWNSFHLSSTRDETMCWFMCWDYAIVVVREVYYMRLNIVSLRGLIFS